MSFFDDKMDAVSFVVALLNSLKPGLPLTMTITRGKSGDSYVYRVTDLSSEDTDPLMASGFLKTQANT